MRRRAKLKDRFGEDVAKLVALVSDDPSITDEEQQKDDTRARVMRAGGFGPVVFAADKVSKVRELRMRLATGLDAGEAQIRLRRYRKALEMLERTIPGTRWSSCSVSSSRRSSGSRLNRRRAEYASPRA